MGHEQTLAARSLSLFIRCGMLKSINMQLHGYSQWVTGMSKASVSSHGDGGLELIGGIYGTKDL